MKAQINKENDLRIQLPFYISEFFKDNNSPLEFKDLEFSTELLIESNIQKIIKFNETNIPISKKKKYKIKVNNIEKVDYEKIYFGEDPALLLRINSNNSNLHDVYVNQTTLSNKDKIGAKNNIVVLYPYIKDKIKKEYFWIIIVYVDPNKEFNEIVTVAKLSIKEILKITSKNIKKPDLIDKIRKYRILDSISIKFLSLNFDDNEDEDILSVYKFGFKSKKIYEYEYKNVPFEEIEKVINDESFIQKFNKRTINFNKNKGVLKLEQGYLDDAKAVFENYAEEIFNLFVEIDIKDLEEEAHYQTDYIIKKVEPSLENYLIYYKDE